MEACPKSRRFRRADSGAARLLTAVLASASAVGCAAAPSPAPPAVQGYSAVEDLQVVDCLLPGQVRQLGRRTYMSPRRPAQTTAADCRIRGGEYVAYDRSDYRTALNVWLPTAETGDAEAQTNVGEIFERGLGDEPNYEMAAVWYRKAAEQGNRRAQFNLATLYEQGLGVPKDRLEALNWYRRAWNLPADDIVFKSATEAEIAKLRRDLEEELRRKDEEIDYLRQELDSLQEQLEGQASRSNDAGRRVQLLEGLIRDLRAARQTSVEQLARLPTPSPSSRAAPSEFLETPVRPPPIDPVQVGDKHLGRYFALIIGNQDYEHLEDLESPLNDVRRAQQVLEDKYGFQVTLLPDADRISVMKAVNQMNELLTEDDNLLIYYSGHGARLPSGQIEAGYWLPVDAEPPPRDTFWVSTEFITRHLSRIKARRVLVVADSCYAGLLSDDPGLLLVASDNPARTLEFKLELRSRLLLAAGGDSPVPHHTVHEHSVFAEAFLSELEDNDSVLTGPSLYVQVLERLETEYGTSAMPQEPELKVIKNAGHELGDFFLVPVGAGG